MNLALAMQKFYHSLWTPANNMAREMSALAKKY
jgi:hypothetical protein